VLSPSFDPASFIAFPRGLPSQVVLCAKAYQRGAADKAANLVR
jgi:hypothetical protein